MLDVKRQDDGRFVVQLPMPVLLHLKLLPERLREVVENRDFTDEIVRRLFPTAYRDNAKETEYRKLLGEDLVDRKLESIRIFEEVIAASTIQLDQAAITIPADRFETWLCLLNDFRLLLGTELDIKEDLWREDFDENDPRAEKFFLLHFLSVLEEHLLRATEVPLPEFGGE